MRKLVASLSIVMFMLSAQAFADVEPDPEIHKVIGGLYSLSCSVVLNGNPQPHINQLRQYFTDVPNDWYTTSQLASANNALWVGVEVGQYSTARKFLREHSGELGITESPGGYAWLGGSHAWMKAADVVNGKLKPSRFSAARGAGTDSAAFFFSSDGRNDWWMSSPSFTPQAVREVISLCGVNNAPKLYRPSGVHTSIYESVKPSDVRKPGDMHVGRKRSSFDMEVELGKDVIFNPIPNRRTN